MQTIRKQGSIRAGDRLAAAVSGGADSVALLRLLLALRSELGIVLSVAHVNHKLRGEESEADEQFVANLAQQHGLELHRCHAPLDGNPPIQRSEVISGIEARARELRYDFFRELARHGEVTKIATAHTLDDQAETVMLRIFRGTGIRGLAGIHPQIAFQENGKVFGEIVRPLLGIRRSQLLAFLGEAGQEWREDSTNLNVEFLRSRVRHRLLPLIAEEFGLAAIEHMAELAEIARAEEQHWQIAHPELGSTPAGVSQKKASLTIDTLLALPLATQRRLVRGWLEANARELPISFRVVESSLDIARAEAGTRMELSPRWTLRRTRHEILLEPVLNSGGSPDYQYALQIPGRVALRELGICIEARVADSASIPEAERGCLLDPSRIANQLLIRNWHPGDRYWPPHTAKEKKVKELLADRHATGTEKKIWPVAVSGDGMIVWMRGFDAPEAFRADAKLSRAIWIREIPALM